MEKIPVFFNNTSDFRKWLEEYHQIEPEVLVGYYKVSTKKPTMTWSDSVDEALCFGWIDGVRQTIDNESYHSPKPKEHMECCEHQKSGRFSQAGTNEHGRFGCLRKKNC